MTAARPVDDRPVPQGRPPMVAVHARPTRRRFTVEYKLRIASGGRMALAQPRGRTPADPQASELVRVQQETARLSRRLAIAEELIAVQKRVAGLLGLTLAESPSP